MIKFILEGPHEFLNFLLKEILKIKLKENFFVSSIKRKNTLTYWDELDLEIPFLELIQKTRK